MLDISHFGTNPTRETIMAKKKLTPEKIFEKLEDLHDQENDLLDSDLDRLVGVTEVMLDGRKDQAEETIAECIASALTNCPSILRVE